jgi:co-chaperonin GroES (HSP10)
MYTVIRLKIVKVLVMLTPNTGRLIVKPIKEQPLTSSGLIIGGQLKAGENLFVGIIVEAGEFSAKFRKGQIVYYSEYSASGVVDMGPVFAGALDMGKATRDENMMIVVSEDDVMAYESEDVDVEAFVKKTQDAKKPIDAVAQAIITT